MSRYGSVRPVPDDSRLQANVNWNRPLTPAELEALQKKQSSTSPSKIKKAVDPKDYKSGVKDI
mgnify:CR=1 FL=1